jgi:hypothetical protein
LAWFKRFYDPIILPDGRTLLTARRGPIHRCQWPSTTLPTCKSRWKCFLAERNGPEMLARIAVTKALNRHNPNPVPAPQRKRSKVYRMIN